MDEETKREAVLMEIAKAASNASATSASDTTEIMLEGIRKVPEQMQAMVDSIVAMQDEFPMPREGWDQFVKDIEYTNEKHGLNLVIRSPR